MSISPSESLPPLDNSHSTNLWQSPYSKVKDHFQSEVWPELLCLYEKAIAHLKELYRSLQEKSSASKVNFPRTVRVVSMAYGLVSTIARYVSAGVGYIFWASSGQADAPQQEGQAAGVSEKTQESALKILSNQHNNATHSSDPTQMRTIDPSVQSCQSNDKTQQIAQKVLIDDSKSKSDSLLSEIPLQPGPRLSSPSKPPAIGRPPSKTSYHQRQKVGS